MRDGVKVFPGGIPPELREKSGEIYNRYFGTAEKQFGLYALGSGCVVWILGPDVGNDLRRGDYRVYIAAVCVHADNPEPSGERLWICIPVDSTVGCALEEEFRGELGEDIEFVGVGMYLE
jgi:hypothetical protein